MYSREEKGILGSNKLYQQILSYIDDSKETIVMSGHYMLMYDRQKEHLKPMIKEDLDDPNQIGYVKDEVGDFPTITFKFGLKLRKQMNGNARLALLVNDHLFLKENKYLSGKGGELRKQYYNNNNIIPQAYKKILKKSNKDALDVLLDNNDASRKSVEILPKSTFLFSEQKLRNNFNNNRKREVLTDSSFKIKKNILGSEELFFNSTFSFKEICLTHAGSCDCAGEVIEFIIELGLKNHTQIIMLVPNECYLPVNNGVESAISYLNVVNKVFPKVIVVQGFGGKGIDTNQDIFDLTIHTS